MVPTNLLKFPIAKEIVGTCGDSRIGSSYGSKGTPSYLPSGVRPAWGPAYYSNFSCLSFYSTQGAAGADFLRFIRFSTKSTDSRSRDARFSQGVGGFLFQ